MKRLRTLLRALGHVVVYWWQGRPIIAPRSVQKHRMETCLGCEHHAAGLCEICECYLAAKTKLSSESCPDHPPRWRAL